MSFQSVIDELRLATQASRCTLRLDVPGDYEFPVTHEALAPGVGSLKDFTALPQRPSPTYDRIERERDIVVMNDCRAAVAGADDEYAAGTYFKQLMDHYGGMAAFIAAPVFVEGELRGVISIHQVDEPRDWSAADVEHAKAAVAAVQDLLATGVVPA